MSEWSNPKPSTPDRDTNETSSSSIDGSILSPRNNSQLLPSPTGRHSPDDITGITLSRPGYETVPSMEELRTMAEDQPSGELIVDDFTVEREGYGKVTFLGETNVYGLNLDEIGKFVVTVGYQND